MVSGFFTSPYDQARIISGDASPILIESKCSTGACCLNNLSKSFIYSPRRASRAVFNRGPRKNHASCLTDWLSPLPASVTFSGGLILLQLHVDAERADLLHQDVEGFRHASIHLVIT